MKGLHSNFVPSTSCYTHMGVYGSQWVCDVSGKWCEMSTETCTQDATANKQLWLDCRGVVQGLWFFSNKSLTL